VFTSANHNLQVVPHSRMMRSMNCNLSYPGIDSSDGASAGGSIHCGRSPQAPFRRSQDYPTRAQRFSRCLDRTVVPVDLYSQCGLNSRTLFGRETVKACMAGAERRVQLLEKGDFVIDRPTPICTEPPERI